MRVSLPTRHLVTPPNPLTCAAAALVLFAVASARGAVPFTVTFSGDGNGPRVTVLNESRQRIAHLELTIGDIAKHFDGGAYSITAPPGGTAVNLTATRTDQISIDLTGFDPGESFSFYFDPDTDGANDVQNYRTILFNNGANTANAFLRVRDEANNLEELELPDPGAADLASYTFSSDARPRTITVRSVSEDGAADYVKKVQVKINSQYVRTNASGALVYPGTDSNGQLLVGPQEAITVYDDEVVEIIAPREVYKDITGADITDSVTADSDNILRFAEELYKSAGLSVNNEPQSALNYYRFTVATNTDVLVQWQHEYALSIGHDFRATASSESGYAGPLFSDADGNPDPPAPKAWIRKGTIVSPTVAGQIVDTISHPNLDIRFINKGYVAGGAAHRANSGPTVVGTNFVEGVYAWTEQGTNLPAGVSLTASLGLPPDRQQVAGFAMSGPAKLVYVWQIQYGIRVSAPGREALPRIFTPNPTNTAQLRATSLGAGTFWFNPDDSVVVAAPALDGLLALNGWFDGDGFYFGSQGGVSTVDGSLVSSGGAAPNVEWQATVAFSDPAGTIYRGLRIPQLTRPARLVWTYGNPGLAVAARLGEFVFQNDPTNANSFITPPDSVTVLNVRGVNQNVAPEDATIWDANAQRLFPLVAGRFRVTWRKGAVPNQATNDVILDVDYPAAAHYPHIAGAPAVALDPDPEDDLVFKAIKYTENGALVDASKRFTATNSGRTVLLFGKIQRAGRGEPREFVQVRVVETTAYTTVLDYGQATIGQKITAPDIDRAKLGTGFVLSFAGSTGQPDRQRFNPFIYDPARMHGLAASEVYDMARLRSTTQALEVIHKEKLPGPIIPVNLHPGASASERIVVLWYQNPALTDTLLWPWRARSYTNRWPAASENLGRIVIASQFGSEGQVLDSQNRIRDQIVAPEETIPGVGTLPAETTYNPSRFQQVQIYSQPDRNQRGFNPNEEHALIAPSLRYADVSPRPPAAYALRDNDLNTYVATSSTEQGQAINAYSSHPYVLVQYLDTADDEFKMRVYEVVKEQIGIPGYRFADQQLVTTNSSGTVSADALTLVQQPYVRMEAGEPVIPFYPLGVVIGATPCRESFGVNLKPQATYWEDHKGSSWAVSGGENAWFTMSFYYPLQPEFYWPTGVVGRVIDNNGTRTEVVPNVGDCIAFLATNLVARPNKILYKSDWPALAPVLKAGETLTFSGGEHRADSPTTPVIDDDGNVDEVQTPGLPGILAFATAEVVFDSLNPTASNQLWRSSWTARVVQALDVRTAPLALGSFPPELAPASGRTDVKSGKYVFKDLAASLQKRVRYDPLLGKLEMRGFLNDKPIGDATLTASPPAVYVLEPNILTEEDRNALQGLDNSQGTPWDTAVQALFVQTRNPSALTSTSPSEYLAGLEQEIVRSTVTGEPVMQTVGGMQVPQRNPANPAPYRAFGPGLALVPNGGFLDPRGSIPPNQTPYPDVSWVTVAENNDPSLGGSPVTLHVIKVDRHERYRGAIKTVASDNVFDENLVLRHTGDFGANATELAFEWWYRVDDGSLDVPPPDLIPAGQTSPWKLFPDPNGKQGVGLASITMKGNPNAPETLLADTFWFCRYRHTNDFVVGTDWNVTQPVDNSPSVNFTWAGAGNSDPLHDLNLDNLPDYRAQLAQGWIKRVLDAVNPYEARIRDFEGNNPSTASSMIRQFGARFEGPVALNPDKNVIENVGLIELYETILTRGRNLSIDLSQPVSTPGIANALQLASTRLSDFYTILGNEAYTDSLDPTIGFSTPADDLSGANPSYGSLAPAVFCFQNQVSSLIDEELSLLRGVDDYFARPVYNRLFWNFTQGESTAAYGVNYNLTDVNMDGFIDEDDAMILFPQGHGDAWGHYLTAVRHQYDLLRHPYFNWVSRSEFYNLQDIVIKVDFLDERKFAQAAAARAKTGSEIVNLTYRQKYVEDPKAQWQGYTDSNPDRAWGVQDWARRAGQGAYFDWVTANALLPSTHPNTTLEGIQKVDRTANSDIAVVSANLNSIQATLDSANKGRNPLGVSGDALVFDIDPTFLEVGSTAQIGTRAVQGLLHFDQIYERALKMLEQAVAVWNNANQSRNLLRQIGNSEAEFRNATFQEDLAYRNQLISLFGKPYEGTIGPGKLYPAGYDGPDLLLFMYVDMRTVDNNTVPGPATSFAAFDSSGALSGGDIYNAFMNGAGGNNFTNIDDSIRDVFSPTFAQAANSSTPILARDGLYAVNYTDLTAPKVPLLNLTRWFPTTAAGYTFQAPAEWGKRIAAGELQLQINRMLQQEAQIASAVGAWDSLQGQITRTLRLINARTELNEDLRTELETQIDYETGMRAGELTLKTIAEVLKSLSEDIEGASSAAADAIPKATPTVGLAVSAGDVLGAVRAILKVVGLALVAAAKYEGIALDAAAGGMEIAREMEALQTALDREELEQDFAVKEHLVALENAVGDEPIKRIEIFKEIQALREMSDEYRKMVDEGIRLIDERIAFNKRVAAQTQRNRFQDMTFRVARNHALQTYRSAFDLAARYAYLAAKSYDYETNFDPSDPGSPSQILSDIMHARTLGQFDGEPRMGAGGIAEALSRLKENYEVLKGQLGLNNPAIEIGKASLRTEHFRILPPAEPSEIVSVDYVTNTVTAGGTGNVSTVTTFITVAPEAAVQPNATNYGFQAAGQVSDDLWRRTLQDSVVDDLWEVPEFRYYCRPFDGEADGTNHVREPGIVLRFGTQITSGRNMFGKPLAGGDNTFDPSHYATKIQSVGVWLSDYQSGDPLSGLPATPRVYLVPVGADVMSIPTSSDPNRVRVWKVLDQRIPVPFAATNSTPDNANWIPLLDSLNGRLGEPRKYSMFRAYADGGAEVNLDELVLDTRLVGRSVWNTEWVMIIPGRMLNYDPEEGIRRFIDQVSDVKVVFRTYSLSGN